MVATISNNPDDFARRGSEIYERSLRSALEPGQCGKFVAIDIDSEAWEIDEDDFAAARRLRDRQPDACIWIMRVGSPAAYRIDGSRKTEAKWWTLIRS